MQFNLAKTDQSPVIRLYRAVHSSKNHEIKKAYTRLIIEQLSSFTLCLKMIRWSSKKLDKTGDGNFTTGQFSGRFIFKPNSCHNPDYHALITHKPCHNLS